MEFIKKNLTVVISVILAIIGALAIYFAVSALSPTVTVVAAKENLKVGTVITEELITTQNFAVSNVPPTAFTSPSDVIGKTIINGPVVSGDVIRSEHLSLDGSLMAALRTFAPEGWTAVELPSGGGAGMTGIKKGDKVNIYGEIGASQGLIVAELVKGAIILSVPDAENKKDQYVIAVPDNYAASIAEVMVRGKPITISLPSVSDIDASDASIPANTPALPADNITDQGVE